MKRNRDGEREGKRAPKSCSFLLSEEVGCKLPITPPKVGSKTGFSFFGFSSFLCLVCEKFLSSSLHFSSFLAQRIAIMLYQRVVLPQGVFNLPSKTILPAFQHLQTLTPLIVSLPSLDVLSSIPISHLSNYVYAVEGFSLQDEEAIYRSLDQGLYLAIVHLDGNTTTLTPEEQEFLRSLPRNRIGLSLSTSNMELIINQYRNLIHHFIVRDVSSENFTQTVGWLRSALKVNESPIEVNITTLSALCQFIFFLKVYLNFVDSTIRCGERVRENIFEFIRILLIYRFRSHCWRLMSVSTS